MVGSNNTGELSAWMEAALYLLSMDPIPPTVTFCFDSKWVEGMVTGAFRPTRHKAMVYSAKRIYSLLKARTTIKWTWVKGHSGQEYNDMADALAGQAKRDGVRIGGRSEQHFYLTPTNLPLADAQAPLPVIKNAPDRISQALLTAAENTFAKLPVKPRTCWITPTLAADIEAVKQRRLHGDPQATQEYKRLKTQARKVKRQWLRDQVLQSHNQGSQALWRNLRKMKTGFRERKSRLKKEGRPVPWDKQHEAFADHLANVQWGPTTVTAEERELLRESPSLYAPSATPPPPFTLIELSDVIKQLRKAKAPGPDNIHNELVLLLDYIGEQQLLEMFNECFSSATVPQEWKEALIVSIYKGKGSDSDPANYRPISLLNTFYKIYAALLQKRLAKAHDHQLRSTQFGFRANRSTQQPLFVLRRLQDLALKTGSPFQLLFLDWRMAFDKVDHDSMIIALERLGVHRQYVDIIRDFYTNQTFYTRGPFGDTAKATPHTGIRQGCPLSPYLFIMVMTVLFSDVDRRLRIHGTPTNSWSVGKPVYDLEYADDTLLISVTKPQMNDILKAIEVEATLYGMLLNKEKTVSLEYNADAPQVLYFADGSPVPITTDTKYLGSQVTWDKATKHAIEARKAKAHISYIKLQHFWRSRINSRTKTRIFHAIVLPTLLYGLDTLTLEIKHLKTIDAWYHKYLRRALGVKDSYYSHISNRRVWTLAGRPTLPSQILTSAQLKQLANSLATPPNNPVHHVVYSPGCKDRIKFTKSSHRGHPQRYWLELNTEYALPVLKEYIRLNRINTEEQRQDFLGLKHLLNRDPLFLSFLESAPTRCPHLFKRHAKALACAWLP